MTPPPGEEPARGTRYYRGLSHLAIRRPLGTAAVAAVVLVLGLFAGSRLAVNLLPEVVYPLIQISVNYPGVAPEIMEEQVTRVLERQLASTEDLVRMDSDAREGQANVRLIFDFGVDLDRAMQDASRLLERARSQLPADVEPPRLRKFDPGASPVLRAGFSSGVRSPREVRDWVENELVPQLQPVPGVSSVDAVGGQVREVEIVLDQQRLGSYGLSLRDVADRLAEENRNIAAGSITAPGYDVLARTDGRFTAPEEIRNVLLPVAGGDSVRLDDVAEVRDGFREQRVFVRLDGVPATELSVYKQPDANTVEVVDGVNAQLERLDASGFIPDDIGYRVTRDDSFFVRGSVEAVGSAALLGGALAMLVVFVFLGSLRKGLVIGLSIPLAVLATFALMSAGGLTLNVMSLGGLALGVGLLLDNAIVMVENISRHRQRYGKSPEEAAHDGADEVASAIVAGTLTNLAAVVPFLFVLGFAALLFRELIVTISFAVLASLAVALTIVPAALAQLMRVRLRSGLEHGVAHRVFERGMARLTDAYEGLLRGALRWRGSVITGCTALLAGALLLMSTLGSEFLPQIDDGEVRVRISLPPGTTPERTNEVSRQVENAIAERPHVQSVFTIAGGQLFGGVVTERPGRVLMEVRLSDAAERPDWPAGRWVTETRRVLRDLDIADARFGVRPPSVRGLTFSVAGEDFDLTLVGQDLDRLEHAAQRAAAALQDLQGLENIEVQGADRAPQLGVDIDRARAAALGVNVSDVGNALRDAVTGAVPTRYATGQREYDVRVRLPRDAINDVDTLGAVVVADGENGVVRLSDVARLQFEDGPVRIQRENQSRIQRVVGAFNTSERDVSATVAEAQEVVAALDLGDDLRPIFGGAFESIQETRAESRVVIALAVFLVLAVLIVQYERLSNPLVIMLTAPYALVGVAGVLWLTATPLSAPVLLGVILLVGIVVNNAILLVEYIERGLRRGLELTAAVVEAGRIRLRPILMTVLTTLSGMLPLALGAGEGADLMRPLALTVVGGLAVSTLLTLVLAPCLFVLVRGMAGRVNAALFGPVEGARRIGSGQAS